MRDICGCVSRSCLTSVVREDIDIDEQVRWVGFIIWNRRLAQFVHGRRHSSIPMRKLTTPLWSVRVLFSPRFEEQCSELVDSIYLLVFPTCDCCVCNCNGLLAESEPLNSQGTKRDKFKEATTEIYSLQRYSEFIQIKSRKFYFKRYDE